MSSDNAASTSEHGTGPAGIVLLVHDAGRGAERLARGLARKGFAVEPMAEVVGVAARLARGDVDVVLVELQREDGEGLPLCARLAGSHPDVPAIALAREGTLESAVGAIRAGAYDYLAPPLRIDAVALAVRRALEHSSLKREVRRLRRVVAERSPFEQLIGASSAMRALYALLDQVAGSDVTLMFVGETGTGKELAARAVHQRSRRRDGPFVAVNCAAVPDALLESELFGHVRGAFTDAHTARPGLFARADGGTLFLDEIGDLPMVLQPKLLRVLQERAVRPVGSDEEVPIDVRVVSATHQDLEAAVADKRFRADLYYRLNVVQIDLPPLRARGRDVLLLAQHFVRTAATRLGKQVAGVSEGAARRLAAYAWPGNVRELENCVERAVALTRHEEITADDLPPRVRGQAPSTVLVAASDPAQLVPMHVVEERYIRRVLAAVGNNKSKAAAVLGLDRKTLYRKLLRYGLEDA